MRGFLRITWRRLFPRPLPPSGPLEETKELYRQLGTAVFQPLMPIEERWLLGLWTLGPEPRMVIRYYRPCYVHAMLMDRDPSWLAAEEIARVGLAVPRLW